MIGSVEDQDVNSLIILHEILQSSLGDKKEYIL